MAARLTELGFSQYEARTYVGLLTSEGATGYTIANATGVPQPKVYETLRRLVERGAAIQVASQPARYVAVPPATVLSRLEADFAARLSAARKDLERLPAGGGAGLPAAVWRVDDFSGVTRQAVRALERARRRVYLSGRTADLAPLADAVRAASEGGAQFVIVHFGRLPFDQPPGCVLRHASTDGAMHPSRQAGHLAVVVDSSAAVWAVARDGKRWEGLYSEDPVLAGVVKAYIRHDLFVQRMYADAPAELEARYGPGLLRLGDLSGLGEEAEAPRATG